MKKTDVPKIPETAPVQERACKRCCYMFEFVVENTLQKQMLCRHSPPAVIAIQRQIGNQMQVTMQNADRPVGPDYWCHQFREQNAPPVLC